MSLQRRLLLYLLLGAPLVWAAALALSFVLTQLEVDELFDSEMVRLAQQVQATIGGLSGGGAGPAASAVAEPPLAERGAADLRDFAVAAWDGDGRLLFADAEGARLPYRADITGFVDAQIDGETWRIYYQRGAAGAGVVAAGQVAYERAELQLELIGGQLAPWLLVLPLLLAAMALAVRRALSPLHRLAGELHDRQADDLRALDARDAPAELAPVLGAMNALFARIGAALERERRFTADAAHELRTPLAALRAQWDVLRGAADAKQQRAAAAKLDAGFERVERLLGQLLQLSRLDAGAEPARRAAVHWPAVVERAIDDCLPLAEQRGIEIACEWPTAPRVALPLHGDEALLAVLLRNLLDNAARYSPRGSSVLLRFDDERIEIDSDGAAPPPEQLARLGERFFRADGTDGGGSGLGLSIARRIAALHDLELRLAARADGGVRATLEPKAA